MKRLILSLLAAAACLSAVAQSSAAPYVPPVEEDVRANLAAWQDLK